MTNRRRNKIVLYTKSAVMLGLILSALAIIYPTQSPSRQWRLVAMAVFLAVVFGWVIWSYDRPDPEFDALEEEFNRERAARGEPPVDAQPMPILPIANSKSELAAGILFVIILIGVIVGKYGFDLF